MLKRVPKNDVVFPNTKERDKNMGKKRKVMNIKIKKKKWIKVVRVKIWLDILFRVLIWLFRVLWEF